MATNSDDVLLGTDGPDLLEGLEGNDSLFGLAGDDYLDGGPGADQMYGGLGDDTFVVDDLGDSVFENGGEGTDTVLSSAPYFVLPEGVEILRLVGDANIAGYGNDGPNQLFGNAGNNTLLGLDSSDFLSGGDGNDYLDSDGGDDTLDGGAGADNLNGGDGDDTYLFGVGYGTDTARDTGGNDSVLLTGGLRVSDVSLARNGSDLEISINGTSDRLLLVDWFSGGTTQIESILFEDETVLDATAIAQAVANQAPTAGDDAAAVTVGDAAVATGTVLANDSDPNGDALAVANPGTYAGTYGTLALGEDGSYTYTLDAGLPAVQALAGGATVTDAFAYAVTDGVALATGTAAATLTVTVTGANDAPQLVAPLADQDATAGQAFEFALPAGAFADFDANDSLTYMATLANENPLPDWLAFDPATGRFTGTPPDAAAGTTLQIRVYASDLFGVAASDVFALDVAADPNGGAPGGQGSDIVGTPCDDRLVGTPFDDRIDGRKGRDVMIGGAGDDTYFVDATQGRHHHGHRGHHGHGHHGHGHPHWSRVDQVVENPNEGHDVVYSKASYALPANVEDLHLLGGGNLDGTGNAQSNWIEGNGGRNTLKGGAGDDLLQGGDGKDTLHGDRGVDVLQGGRGNDTLVDREGSTVFDGGSGNDSMTGGRSADFFAGGRGNDVLRLGGGDDVIAFRKGDGTDRVEGGRQDGVLVLGGVRYKDLLFRKDGADLVLDLGGHDRLVFDDWYRGKHSVATLEIVGAPSAEHAVEAFDFRALVSAFDAARAAARNMRSWALVNELLDAHLASSDGAALGGDLAHQYALNGTLAGMGWRAARETVAAPGFGRDMQALHSAAQLGADPVKLGA
jgi:VCBS repeat-containing protein